MSTTVADCARQAREVVGPGVELYVDAGRRVLGRTSRPGRVAARRLGRQLFDEPVSSDDLAGLRHVRQHSRADVTAGEYGYSPDYFNRMCHADAVDARPAAGAPHDRGRARAWAHLAGRPRRAAARAVTQPRPERNAP
jgi:hypothetical protein